MVAAATAGPSLAQGAYPNRTVRWIIPYAAGGGSDAIARTIQPALQRELGQPVVVENKPGAASAVAAAEVARSAPDGYTIFSADNGTLVYNPALFKKLSYDPKESRRCRCRRARRPSWSPGPPPRPGTSGS
jgi:tripartite-type tricarboxylate transporter receptor subunit TctC